MQYLAFFLQNEPDPAVVQHIVMAMLALIPDHHSRGDCHRHGALLVHPEKGRFFALAVAPVHHSVAWHPGSALRPGLLPSGRSCPRLRLSGSSRRTRRSRRIRLRPETGPAAEGGAACVAIGNIQSRCLIRLPPRQRLPAFVLRPRPPASCMWAARAPLSSIGSMPATITEPWCCAWTTPMSSATPRPACSPFLKACAGWASTGTKSTSNPNALPCTAGRPKPSSPRALPIATSPPPTRATTISPPRRAHGSSIPA